MLKNSLQSQVIAELPTDISDTSPALALLKNHISCIQDNLQLAFNNNIDTILLTQNHAKQMDEVIQAAWLVCERIHINNETSDSQQILIEQTAIIAVGGYGREELFPHSDIDLLILCEDAKHYEATLSAFITLLWDCGLKVGQSVRTVAECIDEAEKDVSVMTSLMESRYLVGNASYHDELTKAIDSNALWPSDTFFAAKLEEQRLRYLRHNNTEYNVEPDIKNAPGGLRDIQILSWVALRHFGIRNFDDLIKFDFITTAELHRLRQSLEHLYRIRFGLHLIAKRDENRLFFNYQKSVAELLGFEDNLANMAVEQLMQAYYRTALTISQLNDMLLQYFQSEILIDESNQQEDTTSINERFEIRDGLLCAKDLAIFQTAPASLLEVFVIYAETKKAKGIHAQTIRSIMESTSVIDEAYRNNPEHISLFIRMFKGKHHLATPMRLMKRYGVLERYMPVFGKIIGMMQFDLFHIYTVDEHTLKVISNTRRLRYKETAESFPLACDVFQQLPNKELLYLGALFHDIAKGRGGDHSELGADEAIAFGNQHKLGEWETNLIAWLTESHLVMSMTAQRKDISDPEVILQFAKQVGDITNLNYLFCLTVADITATNPELLNDWRAQLLRSLYRSTKQQLLRGLDNPVSRKNKTTSKKKSALDTLSNLFSVNDISLIEQHWATLDDEYFMRETSHDIAWHTSMILKHNEAGNTAKPLIHIREATLDQDSEHAAQILIYTLDKRHLFGTIVKTLAQLGISILDARIITSEMQRENQDPIASCINTFIIQDENYMILTDTSRQSKIIQSLEKNIAAPDFIKDAIVNAPLSRQYKNFDMKTYVSHTNDHAGKYTIIGIKALDNRGLLSQISDIFTQFKLTIHNARISTLGERVEDYFFVTDDDGNTLDENILEQLVHSIKAELDNA